MKLQTNMINGTKFFGGKASPGEGAGRIPGAGQCPEVPFHVTVRNSLIYKLKNNSPCVGPTGHKPHGHRRCAPLQQECQASIVHCTGRGRREGSVCFFVDMLASLPCDCLSAHCLS